MHLDDLLEEDMEEKLSLIRKNPEDDLMMVTDEEDSREEGQGSVEADLLHPRLQSKSD